MSGVHKFEVEYAKSNRAACKECKAKIDKDELRIGYSQDIPAGEDGVKNYAMSGTKWYHFHCFPKFKGARWMKLNLCEVSEINGFGALKPEDQTKVSDLWTVLKSAPDASKSPVKGEKRKATTDLAEMIEVQGCLTDAEFAGVKQVKQDFAKKTIAQLKEMLSTNELPKSGTKGELLDMVAEGKILGVLPKCSVCDKARLKWRRQDGKVFCPGYWDEVAGRRAGCKGPAADERIQRIEWKVTC